MTLNRYSTRRDSNERSIIQSLKSVPGIRVMQLSGKGVPDLAIHYPPKGWLLGEVKTAKGKLTPRQADWGTEIRIWRTVDDVLRDLGIIRR